MAIPDPAPGLVIRYSYLWHAEFVAGREEGTKDRPVAIIAAIRAELDGTQRVLVLPITHSPPPDTSDAIEIPGAVKARLGLDEAPSWIVLTEANEFTWPGPDLRRLPSDTANRMAYGFLPPGLFARARTSFIAAVKARKMKRVPRTE